MKRELVLIFPRNVVQLRHLSADCPIVSPVVELRRLPAVMGTRSLDECGPVLSHDREESSLSMRGPALQPIPCE